MEPTTIVIPPTLIIAAIWLIRAIVTWIQSERGKRY
jgi:hypothetical protein